MNVKNQKRVAAHHMGKGKKRIRLDPSKLSEIKEAITKSDLRSLIAAKAITKKPIKGHSRYKARKLIIQKRKGKRKGPGSRKGKKTARLSRKRKWISKMRTQRNFVKKLKEKKLISPKAHREIYHRIKSNRFRTVRLIKLYMKENKLIQDETKKKA